MKTRLYDFTHLSQSFDHQASIGGQFLSRFFGAENLRTGARKLVFFGYLQILVVKRNSAPNMFVENR